MAIDLFFSGEVNVLVTESRRCMWLICRSLTVTLMYLYCMKKDTALSPITVSDGYDLRGFLYLRIVFFVCCGLYAGPRLWNSLPATLCRSDTELVLYNSNDC